MCYLVCDTLDPPLPPSGSYPWDVMIIAIRGVPGGGGGGGFLSMAYARCAAGQGMLSDLSFLNRVYNFALVCPKQGI